MIYVLVRVRPTPGQGFEMAEHDIGEYNRLMEKDGGKPIGNFIVRVGDGSGDHVHLIGYPDMAAYAEAVDRMGSDPDWQKFLARLGSRVASVDLSILRPLADSPLK